MKILYIATRTTLLLVLTILFTVCVNSQSFQWVKKAGGNLNDAGMAVTVDNNNNVYVAGFFEHIAGFDNDSITATGGYDLYIAKYNDAGTVQWVRQAGGGGDDIASDIVVDANGNIYVTGYFTGAAIFDNDTLIGNGERDIFIAKYTSSGICEWAVSAGGTSSDEGNSLCVDAAGNVYITGYFFNGANFGNAALTAYGANDIFIAKCNTNGVWQWAQKAGNSDWDNGVGISIDDAGNLFITGYYGNYWNQPAHFGTIDLPIEGNSDIFISKCDNSGNFLWARKAGGSGGDMGSDITTDVSGNCYATGYFTGTATFETQTLTSDGSDDYYIVKYDTDGNLTWLRQVGGTGYFKSNGISLNGGNFIYLTGTFDNTAVFGDTTLTSAGYDNVFILKYDIDGNFYWAQQAKGSYYHVVQDVNNENADVYITGNLNQQAWFDCFFIESSGSYGGYPSSDIFIAKLNDFINTSKSIDGSPFCAGENISIPFTADYDFDPSNVFTAQLSDLTGCFDNSVTIGTLTGTGSGTINALIPQNTATGTTYRIRIISSNPYIIGTDNGFNLTINQTVANAGTDTIINPGESVTIGSAPIAGYTYSWLPITGLSDAAIANPFAKPDSSTTYYLSVTDNTTGCSEGDSVRVNVITAQGTFCENAVEVFPDTISNELSFSGIDSVMWLYFIPDSENYYIKIKELLLTPYPNIDKLYLYSGTCYNLILYESSEAENPADSLFIDAKNLIIGHKYYIKVCKPQFISGYYNISIKCYSENILLLDCPPPQCDLIRNGNFEIINITDDISPFSDNGNQVCGWQCGWGSPQVKTETNGNHFAFMWSCLPSGGAGPLGESIYIPLNLIPGNYQLEFRYMQSGDPMSYFRIFLSNDLYEDCQSSAQGSVVPWLFINQNYANNIATVANIPTTWTPISVPFTTNQNFNYLYILL